MTHNQPHVNYEIDSKPEGRGLLIAADIALAGGILAATTTLGIFGLSRNAACANITNHLPSAIRDRLCGNLDPLSSGVYSFEAATNVGRVVRSVTAEQSRTRTISEASDIIRHDQVLDVMVPGLVAAVGTRNSNNSLWTVDANNGKGINLSQLILSRPLPEVVAKKDEGKYPLTCSVDPTSRFYTGCIDNQLDSALKYPFIGADNTNQVVKMGMIADALQAEDTNCLVVYLLAQRMSINGEKLTPQEVMARIVRAHVRTVLAREGIAPQAIDVNIDGSPDAQFHPSKTLEELEMDAHKAYSFFPAPTSIAADECVGKADFSSTLGSDLIKVSEMGLERVPDGYNPISGKIEPGNSVFQRSTYVRS